MNNDSFHAELISDAESLKHFDDSFERTLYHNPIFIGKIVEDVLWLGGFKKNKLLCTMPIFKDHLPDYFYYSGPLWNKNILNLGPYRKYATTIRIYKKMIEYLLNIRDKISIQFPSTLHDIRAFDWFNYGKDENTRFKINIRYTAKIKNLQQKSYQDLKLNLRSDDKRKRLNRILKLKQNYDFVDDIENNHFIDLYLQTMNRGGANVSNNSLIILEKLLNYVKEEGRGCTLTLRKSDTKEIIGSQLIIFQDRVANAIAQGIDKKLFSSEVVTYLIFSCILKSKEKGMIEFDFNGANSPNRADDKHAYGAEEFPYYSLEFGN